MKDPLKVPIEYLNKQRFKVLYASYIGSYKTEDWIEGISDIDILIVVNGKKPRNLPNLDHVDVSVLTLEDTKDLDPLLAIDIVLSTPEIDIINLREIAKKKLNSDTILALLDSSVGMLDEFSKDKSILRLVAGYCYTQLLERFVQYYHIHITKSGVSKN